MFEPLETPTHFDMGAYIPALRRAGSWLAARWKTPQSALVKRVTLEQPSTAAARTSSNRWT